MSRVPQERDPTEVPGRERVPIHHRIVVDDLRAADHRRHIEEVEVKCRKRLEHLFEARGVLPVLLGHRLVVGGFELGHPVDERSALVLVALRSRVDYYISAGMPRVDHRAAGEERLTIDHLRRRLRATSPLSGAIV